MPSSFEVSDSFDPERISATILFENVVGSDFVHRDTSNPWIWLQNINRRILAFGYRGFRQPVYATFTDAFSVPDGCHGHFVVFAAFSNSK